MKFIFEKLILWNENNILRELTFEPNKINVITGKSNTGKTAILDIIDYCFVASDHHISESIINENVTWYGIKFNINDKTFTIARKSPSENIVSNDFFFSSIGNIPTLPTANNTGGSIKSTLEAEFGINQKITMPFGANSFKKDSKISFRYFLLFNTISDNIIENSAFFFDKQNIPRYREALTRIFNIAVGIESIENIIKREELEKLENELEQLENKKNKIAYKKDAFQADLEALIKKAKSFGVIAEETHVEDALDKLNEIVKNTAFSVKTEFAEKYEEINRELFLTKKKIKNLQTFESEYKKYKQSVKINTDSLKPIEFLTKKSGDIIKTSIFEDVVDALKQDLQRIKHSMQNKTAIDIKVEDIQEEYSKKLLGLQEKLNSMPEELKPFSQDAEKYIFIGELKAKLDLYVKKEPAVTVDLIDKLDGIKEKIDALQVDDINENKALFIDLLEEIIKGYMEIVGDALANYEGYQPVFNYKEKKLQLRKPKTDFIEHVGSSSNHMFLHLFLFLGLHEVILRKKVKFIPSFLIIDQPSRPYWGDEKNPKQQMNETDEYKIIQAFKLLDSFMDIVKGELKESFQMIVFEHIPPRIWEGMSNVHLVDEFRDGNALIQQQ